MPVEQGFIQVEDGLRLWYSMAGDSPNIVVVPDAGWLLEDFEPLFAERTFIFCDMRGRGASDPVTDSSQLQDGYEVRDIEAVRQHFEIERISLIGWSRLGGAVALYAIDHPERVERLVLMCPITPRSDPPYKNSPQREEALNARINPEGIKGLEELRKIGIDVTYPAVYCRQHQKVYLARQFGKPEAFDTKRSDPCEYPNEWPKNLIDLIAKHPQSGPWDWRPKLTTLQAPVLVVQGDDDVIPLASAQEWAATLPNARLLVVPGAGHFPHLEDPELFFPSVDTFLSGQWPETAQVVRISSSN